MNISKSLNASLCNYFLKPNRPAIKHICHKYILLRLLVLLINDVPNVLPYIIRNAVQKRTNEGYVQATFEATIKMYNEKELVE